MNCSSFMRCNSVLLYISRSRSLLVEPLNGLLTEPTRVTGNGFQSNEKLTIRCRLFCKEEKFDFSSVAKIYTNSSGCFDLAETPSLGGTYTGIEKMGLFWSMKSNEILLPQLLSAKRLLIYNFDVFEGHTDSYDDIIPLEQYSVARTLAKEGVTRKEINMDGLVGTLFIPEGDGPFPAAVTMHGGVKQKHVIEDFAAVFANKGVVMLALAFFGVEGLPKHYHTQPIYIEYFEKALKFLQSLDQVSSQCIGAVGSSKGGEIALGMTTFLPELKFCCLFNALISNTYTPLLYKGKIMSTLDDDYKSAKYMSSDLIDTFNFFENPRKQPSTLHNFFKSNADTLFVIGEKDSCIPSSMYADIYQDEMDKKGKDNFKILRYPNMGHLVSVNNAPIVTISPHPMLPKGKFADFGGGDNRSGYAKDLANLWEEVFKFIEKQKMSIMS